MEEDVTKSGGDIKREVEGRWKWRPYGKEQELWPVLV
jgi:hypothetical protein